MLTGKAVVVTGAGRGLGAAYVRLACGYGASVVVNDVDGELAAAVAAEVRASRGIAVADDSDVAER